MAQTKRALDRDTVEGLRHRLLDARARLLRTVATTDEELDTLETHVPGAPIEDAAREEIRGILSRLGARERLELEEIYAAHARLEAGTFGICEECGEPIPLARLQAVPTTRRCLSCQARRERPEGA